jgi:hypothetical protein
LIELQYYKEVVVVQSMMTRAFEDNVTGVDEVDL